MVHLWGGQSDSRYKTPWKEDTLCMCWSVTKAIASLCIAKLADEGLIDFDCNVSTYWPEFAQNGKENVTVAQLMSHQVIE